MKAIIGASLEKPIRLAKLDNRKVKKGLRKVGQAVAKIARKALSKRYKSKEGEFPSRQTGRLRRAVKSRTSKSGFTAFVYSGDIKGTDEQYAHYVYYGHRGPGTDRNSKGEQDKRQRGRKRQGKKVAPPRENWIVYAAKLYGAREFPAEAKKIVQNSLKEGYD